MAIKASELMKLRVAFMDLQNKVLASCVEVIDETCENVFMYALESTPVDTGNLRRSLHATTPSYSVMLGATEVSGEVHFGEPGNIGGWHDTEAYTYMWHPGKDERKWHGAILYKGWEIYKGMVLSDLSDRISMKLGRYNPSDWL